MIGLLGMVDVIWNAGLSQVKRKESNKKKKSGKVREEKKEQIFSSGVIHIYKSELIHAGAVKKKTYKNQTFETGPILSACH